jgi:hypothetical protein
MIGGGAATEGAAGDRSEINAPRMLPATRSARPSFLLHCT